MILARRARLANGLDLLMALTCLWPGLAHASAQGPCPWAWAQGQGRSQARQPLTRPRAGPMDPMGSMGSMDPMDTMVSKDVDPFSAPPGAIGGVRWAFGPPAKFTQPMKLSNPC